MRWAWLSAVLAAAVVGVCVIPVAAASTPLAPEFPYPTGINLPESPAYHLNPGEVPQNFSELGDWELSATPSLAPLSEETVNDEANQLCGIRGISLVDAYAA